MIDIYSDMRYSNTYKGRYRPKNPEKYKGDPTKVVYRSGLELRFMNYLDTHPNVIEWSSEEIIVPYMSPLDNKAHRYFPDFLVKVIKKNGDIAVQMIEIKPKSQTSMPVKKSRKTKRYIEEAKTYAVNEAKWIAASVYCKQRGWEFRILTDKELGVL